LDLLNNLNAVSLLSIKSHFDPDRTTTLGVTLARFYCDRNTRNAFSRLFSELFRLIPELTGSILKFFAFFPDDPEALLHAIILDAEAAQAQGLADELLLYVAKNVSESNKTLPRNALDLIMMILKTCYIHYWR
jgi:hypothetical protein